MLDGLTAAAVIADKAYDTDAILQAVVDARALPVIPPRATRIHQRQTDWQLYQQRHKIENLFGFVKHYRRVFAASTNWRAPHLSISCACFLLR
jgi:transposase